MNRAMRRAAAKAKPMQAPKVVPLPALLDEFTVFDHIDTLLLKIGNGHIETVQGVPVFRDNEGKLTQVCPALQGWIETWQMINEKLGLVIPIQHFQLICNKLHYDTIITERDLKLATATNAYCKAVFRQRRKEITEVAKLAQFKILLESK